MIRSAAMFAVVPVLAMLGGCRFVNRLDVTNRGTETTVVEVSYHEDGHDGVVSTSFEVAPGQGRRGRFPDADVAVLIYRKSDQSVLYWNYLTKDDFGNDTSRVEITVYP